MDHLIWIRINNTINDKRGHSNGVSSISSDLNWGQSFFFLKFDAEVLKRRLHMQNPWSHTPVS